MPPVLLTGCSNGDPRRRDLGEIENTKLSRDFQVLAATGDARDLSGHFFSPFTAFLKDIPPSLAA